MSNPSKAKGTRWETAIVRALDAFFAQRHGLRPYRPAQAGSADSGDIHGISPFVIQAKDCRRHDLSGWLDGPKGVIAQAEHAGEPYGVLVVKRPRRPVAQAYAVMRTADLARIIIRLRRAETLLQTHAPNAHAVHVTETTAESVNSPTTSGLLL